MQWLQAPAIGGPRTAARTLPPRFGRLPADENWKDARAAASTRVASTVPTVFVSTVPAELILLRGTGEAGVRAGGGRRR